MSIKTRLITLIAAFMVVLLALGVLLSYALDATRQLSASAREARVVYRAVLDLTLLIDDYTIAPTARAEEQWRLRHETLRVLISQPPSGIPGEEEWLSDIREDHRRLGAQFEELSGRLTPEGTLGSPRALSPYEIRLAGQMRMLVLSIAEVTAHYETSLEEQRSSAERQVLVLAVVIAGGSGLLTVGAAVTVWGTLGAPLLALREGVRTIAGGDLEHRIPVTTRGEIGDLAHAFNEMAEAVDHSTEDLEAMVAQRTGQLLEINRQLEEATMAKDRFMARMSHELRTPLNSIIGFSQIMREGSAGSITEEQAVQLEMVNKAGKRLLSLVNDLLDISRIAAGGIEVGCGVVSISEIVDDLAETVAPLIADAGLNLEHSSDGPLEVTTDRAKVEQILLNFLSNAIKFTDAGTIWLRAESSGSNAVRITVRDTGKGIAPQHLPELFDEFRQFPEPDDTVQPGSGLGLAIAHSLAELIGGAIEVESEPGAGSAFTLVLPRDASCARVDESGFGATDRIERAPARP